MRRLLLGAHPAAHRVPGKPAYPGQRRGSLVLAGAERPQPRGLARRLVRAHRALGFEEVADHDEIGDLHCLHPAMQVLDAEALGRGASEHEGDDAHGQDDLDREPGPRVEDDRARLPHGVTLSPPPAPRSGMKYSPGFMGDNHGSRQLCGLALSFTYFLFSHSS